MSGRRHRLALVFGLVISLAIGPVSAFTQELEQIGPVVDLTPSCGLWPRLLQVDGQWLALWAGGDDSARLTARRGPDLWSLDPPATLAGGAHSFDAASQPGGFAVVWSGDGDEGYLALFQSDFTPIGSPIPLSAGTKAGVGLVAIAADPAGALTVAWTTPYLIYARRFSANGVPLTPPIEVSPLGVFSNSVDVEHSPTSFLVAWMRNDESTFQATVRAFDLAGSPLGSEAVLGAGGVALSPRQDGFFLTTTAHAGAMIHPLGAAGTPAAPPVAIEIAEVGGERVTIATDDRQAWMAAVVNGGISVQPVDLLTGLPLAPPQPVASPSQAADATTLDLSIHGDGLALAWQNVIPWPFPTPPCVTDEPSQAILLGPAPAVDVPVLAPGGVALFALLLAASAWWLRR